MSLLSCVFVVSVPVSVCPRVPVSSAAVLCLPLSVLFQSSVLLQLIGFSVQSKVRPVPGRVLSTFHRELFCCWKHHHDLWTRAHPSDGGRGHHDDRSCCSGPTGGGSHHVHVVVRSDPEPVEPVQDLTSLSLDRQAGAG